MLWNEIKIAKGIEVLALPFMGNQIRPTLIWDDETVVLMTKKSLEKFTQYDVETVICYHGGVYQENVNERLQKLAND